MQTLLFSLLWNLYIRSGKGYQDISLMVITTSLNVCLLKCIDLLGTGLMETGLIYEMNCSWATSNIDIK
jgi:hypothetical protein